MQLTLKFPATRTHHPISSWNGGIFKQNPLLFVLLHVSSIRHVCFLAYYLWYWKIMDTQVIYLREVKQNKNKVSKTWARKKLFSLKINRYIIFHMAFLINEYTSRSFVFLLWSGLDLTSSKLVTSCRQDPYGSKAYTGSRLDYVFINGLKPHIFMEWTQSFIYEVIQQHTDILIIFLLLNRIPEDTIYMCITYPTADTSTWTGEFVCMITNHKDKCQTRKI